MRRVRPLALLSLVAMSLYLIAVAVAHAAVRGY